MALWLIRAGRYGEHEQRFLDDNRVYLTWSGFKHDLSQVEAKSGVRESLEQTYSSFTKARVSNNTGQIWAFSHKMQIGDLIATPSKHKPAIHIGEIIGPYTFNAQGNDPYYHYRDVRWIKQDVPRSIFDQDILYSLGAFMTICEIKRNEAEKRVQALANRGWIPSQDSFTNFSADDQDEDTEDAERASDLEVLARDQIAKLIQAKFKGHGMARLVEAILQSQGYTTYRSPEGPDKGVDILAASGPLGFGQPRICVQVKSGDTPLDRPTLQQLSGAMQEVDAQHGLFVSWGGFRSSVDREEANQFFRIRLWDQDNLIDHLLDHYDKLDDDLRADLPLKRVWTIATLEEAAE